MALTRLRRAFEIAGHGLRQMARPSSGAHYGIKEAYRHRGYTQYFDDVQDGIVYQPDVYGLAAQFGKMLGKGYLVDVGCGRGEKLIASTRAFGLTPIGIDFGANLQHCRNAYPGHAWLEDDLEHPREDLVDAEILAASVIVCADVVEHLADPTALVALLRAWLVRAPLALLTTPERDLTHGAGHRGPPLNAHHVREWNAGELEGYLSDSGVNVMFMGLTRSSDRSPEMKTTLALLGPTRTA